MELHRASKNNSPIGNEARIINQRGENNEQVSIRYLSEKAEVENSEVVPPRLEDLYLWLFPSEEKNKEEG